MQTLGGGLEMKKIDAARNNDRDSLDRQASSTLGNPSRKIVLNGESVLGTSSEGLKVGTEKTGSVPKVKLQLANTVGVSSSGLTTGSTKAGVNPKFPKD